MAAIPITIGMGTLRKLAILWFLQALWFLHPSQESSHAQSGFIFFFFCFRESQNTKFSFLIQQY